MILEITITKYTLPKTASKAECNDVLIFLFDVYCTHKCLSIFRQKVRLFSDFCFCMDIMMGMVKEDNSTTFLEVLGHARPME